MQEGHLVAFFNAKLGGKMQLALIYAKEMYFIVQTVVQWKHYLLYNRDKY